MDTEKFKQWMDISKQNKSSWFWDFVFENQNEDIHSFFSNDDFELVEFDEARFPHIDIFKTESEITILVELPGVNKKDVKIGLNGNTLIIEGTVEKPKEYQSVIKSERYHGPFSRKIRLPEHTDGRNIIAKLEDGLLEINYLIYKNELQEISISDHFTLSPNEF